VATKAVNKRSVYRIEQATYRTAAYASYVARREAARPDGTKWFRGVRLLLCAQASWA
jgi:hypothetical protein